MADRDAGKRLDDARAFLEGAGGTAGTASLLQGIRSRLAQAFNADQPLEDLLPMIVVLGGGEGLVWDATRQRLAQRFGADWLAVAMSPGGLARLLGPELPDQPRRRGALERNLNLTERAMVGAQKGRAPVDLEGLSRAHAWLRDRLGALTPREAAILIHLRLADAGSLIPPPLLDAVAALLRPSAERVMLERTLLSQRLGMSLPCFGAEGTRLCRYWLELREGAHRATGVHPFGDPDDEH